MMSMCWLHKLFPLPLFTLQVSKKKKKTKAAAPSQDAGVADKPATGRRGKTQQRGDNGAAGAAKAVAKRQGRQKKEEEEARSGSSSEEVRVEQGIGAEEGAGVRIVGGAAGMAG